jgi:flagellar biogenesis protein FliO
MYDALAEIFVYGLALIYLILFIVLAQYWVRTIVRANRKKPHYPPTSKPQGPLEVTSDKS